MRCWFTRMALATQPSNRNLKMRPLHSRPCRPSYCSNLDGIVRIRRECHLRSGWVSAVPHPNASLIVPPRCWSSYFLPMSLGHPNAIGGLYDARRLEGFRRFLATEVQRWLHSPNREFQNLVLNHSRHDIRPIAVC
jgi:hypothetical protein